MIDSFKGAFNKKFPLFRNNNYYFRNNMKKNILIIVLSIVSVFFIGYTIVLNNNLRATEENLSKVEEEYKDVVTKHDKYIKDNSLSEWDMFTLALMKVESNYNISAVSSVGAKGYFQLMPIYVEEVNRIHKTNYKYEDVIKSFEKSYEVFTLMQEAHNKDFSMDKALRLHNGDHEWYHQRVYNAMSEIKRYEEMRKMLSLEKLNK